MHYLDVRVLMPQVIKSVETLVGVYQQAAAQSPAPPAAEVVSRILGRHQAHLGQLHGFEARSKASA